MIVLKVKMSDSKTCNVCNFIMEKLLLHERICVNDKSNNYYVLDRKNDGNFSIQYDFTTRDSEGNVKIGKQLRNVMSLQTLATLIAHQYPLKEMLFCKDISNLEHINKSSCWIESCECDESFIRYVLYGNLGIKTAMLYDKHDFVKEECDLMQRKFTLQNHVDISMLLIDPLLNIVNSYIDCDKCSIIHSKLLSYYSTKYHSLSLYTTSNESDDIYIKLSCIDLQTNKRCIIKSENLGDVDKEYAIEIKITIEYDGHCQDIQYKRIIPWKLCVLFLAHRYQFGSMFKSKYIKHEDQMSVLIPPSHFDTDLCIYTMLYSELNIDGIAFNNVSI